jgi:hypothetical protein
MGGDPAQLIGMMHRRKNQREVGRVAGQSFVQLLEDLMERGVGVARGGQRGDALHDRAAPWGALWLATDDRAQSWLAGWVLVAIRSCESA